MTDTQAPTSAPLDLTECTQANVLAEAAANMAAIAAAKAAEARAKAAEALARAEAIRAAAASLALDDDQLSTADTAAQPCQAADASPARGLVETLAASDASPAPVQESPRPDTSDRRIPATHVQPAAKRPERRPNAPRGETTGRRATDLTDNSGIIRLGDAVRAKVSAQVADRRAVRHIDPVRAPGALLEPTAHVAGLGVPHRTTRRVISPGIVFLFALMGFFGLYATGNLPQFDRWAASVFHSTQAHNADVVDTIVNGWRMIAWCGAGFCILLIAFLIFNTVRARSNNR